MADDAGSPGTADEKAFQVALLEDELSVSGTAGMDTDTAVGTDDNETVATDGGDAADGAGDNETVGGDAATDGGAEGTSRLRIFHAVVDVDALTVSAVDAEDGAGEAGDGADGDPVGNETAGDAGDDTLGGDGANETNGAGDVGADADPNEAQLSTEAGAVYSGLAVGYFDPEAAAMADGGDAGVGGNETAGGDDGGNGLLDGDNETGANGTEGDAAGEDGVTEDVAGKQFEFVTVKDAQDGERTDGGSGGLLP
jgi:hypothetical protein